MATPAICDGINPERSWTAERTASGGVHVRATVGSRLEKPIPEQLANLVGVETAPSPWETVDYDATFPNASAAAKYLNAKGMDDATEAAINALTAPKTTSIKKKVIKKSTAPKRPTREQTMDGAQALGVKLSTPPTQVEIDQVQGKVKVLQRHLNRLKFDVGRFGIDGKLGPDTKAALAKFSAAHPGIKPAELLVAIAKLK
jgi:hypothetical protein